MKIYKSQTVNPHVLLKGFVIPCLLFYCMAILSGCKKSEDSSDNICTMLPNNTIQGSIHNFATYSSSIDSIYLNDGSDHRLGKCKVNSDGSFSIVLSTPPASYLDLISDGMLDGISYSDKNAMVCSAAFFYSTKNLIETHTIRYESSLSLPYSEIEFIYCDRTCSMTGSGTATYNSPIPTTLTMSMNITLNKGWNVVGVVNTGTASNQQTIVTKELSSGCNWLIENP
jgi:hypothetical protein